MRTRNSIRGFVRPSVSLSIRPSVGPPVRPSVGPFIHPSVVIESKSVEMSFYDAAVVIVCVCEYGVEEGMDGVACP